ncbi:MAG TPA: FUN14 domain-containing protein [Nitrososphaeraceae archaeon]|nr:FUN14 domain-containing protein [Nitrososphaeraceae archaeon]
MVVVEAAAQNVTSLTPLLTTVGFGGLVGYLIGIAIRYIVKIIAIIAGLFLAALMYLQSQGIVNVNWTKLQAMSQPVLLSLTNSLNSTKSGIGVVVTGHNTSSNTTTAIPNLIHNSLPFIPIDIGLPLVGSAGLGFILGLTRR